MREKRLFLSPEKIALLKFLFLSNRTPFPVRRENLIINEDDCVARLALGPLQQMTNIFQLLQGGFLLFYGIHFLFLKILDLILGNAMLQATVSISLTLSAAPLAPYGGRGLCGGH